MVRYTSKREYFFQRMPFRGAKVIENLLKCATFLPTSGNKCELKAMNARLFGNSKFLTIAHGRLASFWHRYKQMYCYEKVSYCMCIGFINWSIKSATWPLG